MQADGNSVNIKEKPYHHGGLRSALIAEGLRLLGSRDAEALSLREVARGVGVSATSVYRHFPDKQALLTALASEGLARLGAAQRQAEETAGCNEAGGNQASGNQAGGSQARFAATGRAYIRFALANPALFRLIFASPALTGEQKDGEAARLLHANAAAIAARHGGEARLHAIHGWALVHGLAMLMLDGQIAVDDTLIESITG